MTLFFIFTYMYIKRNIFLTLLFFVSLIVTAQTYNFTNYNVGEGLEQSDILCVSQSSNGYLLYGSNGGGLGFYDGYNFNSIKEKNGLSNNIVFSIEIDSYNYVWCVTNSGVNKIDNNLKKVLNIYKKGFPFYSTSYAADKDIIYFGSQKGVYYYDNEIDSLQYLQTNNEKLNSSAIMTLFNDKQGNLWAGTKRNGLFKIEGKRVLQFSLKTGMPSNYIKTIIESKDKIWVGSLMGLTLIEADTISDFTLPSDWKASLTITSATMYKNELVFGALNNHLYFVNPKNNKYRIINAENGFNYKKVWSLYTDTENVLWLGVIGQGLVKYNPTFTYFNEENGLSNSYIHTIFCDKNETWVGHKSNGIDIIRNNQIIKRISTENLGTSIVNRITKIKGVIYIGTNSGIKKYINGELKNISFSGALKNDVYAIYPHNNKVYVGTKLGLYIINGDSLFSVENTPTDFIFDLITYENKLYMASNGGYYVYDGDSFNYISKQEDFDVGRVRSFVIDEERLWIGTNSGIYIKKGNTHKKVDEDNGLSSDNIYFLKKDKEGYIWAGSNKGVDRIEIKSVYANIRGQLTPILVRNYSKPEGLIGVECNLNAVDINTNNEMWFGTINGAFIYNQKEDVLNNVPPNVTLNNIKLNFNDVDWKNYTSTIDSLSGLPSNLDLTYKNNNLIFEYVGVSLRNPEKVFYQYQLEGLDEDWLPLTQDRKAVYTALSPGSYTFKLRAKNNDNVWTEDPITYSFIIAPPWYQTKTFYTIAVLLLIIAVYLIIYVRTRNLKKTQEILTKKVDERTKELREEKEKVEHVNTALAEQKTVIEVANKNITDSINYAKKIQDAILPHINKLDDYVKKVSVLYMPKDVVSGDFYWFEKIGDKLILAVSDCTGHGVPGAFMSMIGVNNLNQIILEKHITNPSLILSELNKAIKTVLQQEAVDSESRDGMDISICCFDLKENTVQYAGAFRPLIYIRDNELIELKGSRQPIGGSAPFNFVYDLNEFSFLDNDVFYMFSDGYPDQFGGVKGKKFMNKRLKQLFMENFEKTPQEQELILKQELINWMGDEEQIDDVLVMCVKF